LPGVLACIVGIYLGDLLLYFSGRLIGRPILRWKPVRRLLTDAKLDRASEWLVERGAGVVILSRFTPGLRLPTYVAAGLLRTRFWTFSLYFLLAAVLWTPALVGAAVLLGRSLQHVAFAGPAVLLVASPFRKLQRGWQTRRRALGWLRRRTRWEFWPAWITYIPVVPYILFLGFKHRSLTLFTVANPGIPSGGFVGESKSAILSNLSRAADFTLVGSTLRAETRVQLVKDFLTQRGLPYPVVLKPDVGERGTGVSIARCDQDVVSYFRTTTGDTIVQRFIGGLEFGIFYYRYPEDSAGRIFSITEKRFPAVIGNGSSTITDFVLRDERAVCLADLYLRRLKRPVDEVPTIGETVPLAELGSHCRGAIFLNGAHLETEALASAVHAIARSHPGFFFGRFDIRSSSIADLQAGRFDVLELNGVSAEATHIYDPSVSVLDAYRVLFHQWRVAFEIGAANRAAGVQPMRFRDFVRLLGHETRSRPTLLALP